ncbi:MAG: extracellular solute-binding protein [Alphaproteobacteria bacterium]
MGMRSYLVLLLCFSLLPLATARADEDLIYHGLAMHGAPKYNPADTHLDYANPEAPKGGRMSMAAIGTFDTLNPYAIKGKAALGLNLFYDRLMARVWDEPFTMYPLIAEKVSMPEDRSAITVYLNPSARFHDGTEISADDVIFSFETLRDSGRPNMRKIYRIVKDVQKIDERTVSFIFGEGYDRETAMIIAMMPVLSKSWWSGRTFDSTTLDIPVSNGPYKIKSFEPGRRITYERDPDYWAANLLPNAGHYNFDEITYDYFRDDTIAFEAFKSGDITLRREQDAGRWASAYDFPALREERVKAEALPHGRPERVNAFIFNTRRPPFNDIRVRKALELLFDFDWANKNLFHGLYKQIDSYFPNSELAAKGAPSPLELDMLSAWKDSLPPEIFQARTPDTRSPREKMREADRLLREAGWSVENGKRVKDGKPFRFEIVLDAPENEKIALHFKRALERMGIDVLICVLDSAAYRGRLNEYDFDMTLYYWLSSLSPGTEQILYWGCAAADEPARWNFAGVCDPAIDLLAGAIASTHTREELVASVRALDRILISGHYMIPLYYSGKDYVAYWNPIHHPQKTPLYGMVLETWWMDMPEDVNRD